MRKENKSAPPGDGGIRLERKIRFYRALGAARFKRLVFGIERAVRRGDGGRNANYHIDGGTPRDMRRCAAFTAYHAALHIAGLLFGLVYLAARISILPASKAFIAADAVIAAASAAHVCLLILQRYNSLALERHEALYRRSLALKAERMREAAGAVYGDQAVRDADRERLERVISAVDSGGCLILGDGEAAALQRAAGLAEAAGYSLYARRRGEDAVPAAASPTVADLAADPRLKASLFARSELLADGCARLLGKKDTGLLSVPALVCGEDAFPAAGRLASGGLSRLRDAAGAADILLGGEGRGSGA